LVTVTASKLGALSSGKVKFSKTNNRFCPAPVWKNPTVPGGRSTRPALAVVVAKPANESFCPK
jgi:hypothetical protein